MLPEHSVACPWCWESIDLLIDTSVGEQHYVEDCSVCCRPILVRIEIQDAAAETVRVSVDRE